MSTNKTETHAPCDKVILGCKPHYHQPGGYDILLADRGLAATGSRERRLLADLLDEDAHFDATARQFIADDELAKYAMQQLRAAPTRKRRGTSQRPPAAPKPNPRPKGNATGQGLLDELDDLGWRLRFNTRAARVEICQGWKAEWRQMTERHASDFREALTEKYHWGASPKRGMGRLTAVLWNEMVLVASKHTECDPFEDWLEKLEWDGKPRVDTLLIDVMRSEDTLLARWAARSILLGSVRRTYEPGAKHDEVVVLIGPQGTAKSTFVERLVPHHSLVTSDFALDSVGTAKAVEPTLGVVLVEIGELAGMRRADVEKLKTHITRRIDRVRLSYRRDAESIPRRFVFVGTTNEREALPADPSGNRRWVPIPVKGRYAPEVVKALDAIREQLWAEATERYKEGEKTWLYTDELTAAAAAAAEEHRSKDAVEEQIAARADLIDGHTLKEIADSLGSFSAAFPRGEQMRLARALQHQGYVRRQNRVGGVKGRRWYRT